MKDGLATKKRGKHARGVCFFHSKSSILVTLKSQCTPIVKMVKNRPSIFGEIIPWNSCITMYSTSAHNEAYLKDVLYSMFGRDLVGLTVAVSEQ